MFGNYGVVNVLVLWAGLASATVQQASAAPASFPIALAQPPGEKGAIADAPAKDQNAEPGDDLLLELYSEHKILTPSAYPKIRRVFAERFEAANEATIRQTLGEPSGAVRRWLAERQDIKEEFYLAIDPQHDNISQALTLFKTMEETFPDKIETYANLAIAVSVVWDKERGAIHTSPIGQHCAIRAESELDALGNFKYYIDMEPIMGGRIRFLPWEFLVHVVNHRTPLVERQWAVAKYLSKRQSVGKCANEVPYDTAVLTGTAPPQLKDKVFSLPNQKLYGGVCTCQADFAARIAKSLGIPAFVAGVPGNTIGHAFVEWIDLENITRTGFTFSLKPIESAKSVRAANARDPHTGQRVKDRDLELALHTVGMAPIANRHAGLVMRAYPMLRERSKMNRTQQLAFLRGVIEFCPGNPEPWRALAKMSRDGEISKAEGRLLARIFDSLITTFHRVPDFVAEVFDDLIACEDRPKQRAALYGRFCALVAETKRRDLMGGATMKYADSLVADGRAKEAREVLASFVIQFLQDGPTVLPVVDKLDALCQADSRGQKFLVSFYLQVLPQIKTGLGKSIGSYNGYCITMYKRGIKQFKEAGLLQLAQTYEMQLRVLEDAKNTRAKMKAAQRKAN